MLIVFYGPLRPVSDRPPRVCLQWVCKLAEVEMGLEIRRTRDGKWRRSWYGAYMLDGRRYAVNLGVKIAGTPPASLKLSEEGDIPFERSRVKAQHELDKIIEESQTKSNATHLVEHLYEVKTGEKLKYISLDELADHWERIPRRRKPSAKYVQQCRSRLENFIEYVQGKDRHVTDIGQVTRSLAEEYMKKENERGVSPKTWNDTLKLLRTTFDHLLPNKAPNTFDAMPTKHSDTVFRHPFTPDELKAIVDEAQKHPFIRPIIITGICTAMRRGDCCMLKWSDVDMMNAFIVVKTSKTGQTVNIPIFPLLFDELSLHKRTGTYVFPEQAAMYQQNPDGITWRVKKVLVEAFSENKEGEDTPLLDAPEEVRPMAHEHIDSLGPTDKAARMREAFDLYMDEIPSAQICRQMGISKGSLSGYLNELEAATGLRIVRGRTKERSATAKLKADSEMLRSTRDQGQRRASVRDFHSFRVTWVTLALNAGVPLELVQKVTGHKTTEVVLKHYFRPGREDFRNALNAAMPELLTQKNAKLLAEPAIEYEADNSPSEELDQAIKILNEIKSPKYTKQIKEAIQLIASAKQWYDSTVLREQ